MANRSVKKRNNQSKKGKKSRNQRGGLDPDMSSILNSSSRHDISSIGSFDDSDISSIPNTSSVHDISSIGSFDDSDISSIPNDDSSVRDVSVDNSFDYSNDDTMSDIGDAGEEHDLSDQSFDYSVDDDGEIPLNNLPPLSPDTSDYTTMADEDSSQDSSQGSLHLSDLQGGRKSRKTRKTRKGKKSRKTKKGRKGKKSKKTKKGRKGKKSRKQRGGMRYGTGVGANCVEPNYSIYNTPALSLFPYKPN